MRSSSRCELTTAKALPMENDRKPTSIGKTSPPGLPQSRPLRVILSSRVGLTGRAQLLVVAMGDASEYAFIITGGREGGDPSRSVLAGSRTSQPTTGRILHGRFSCTHSCRSCQTAVSPSGHEAFVRFRQTSNL